MKSPLWNQETGELRYREDGPVMNPEPVGSGLGYVTSKLRFKYTAVVILEPGDATRYDFMLTPLLPEIGNYTPRDQKAGVVVVRFRGGDAIACGVILLNRDFHDDVPALACGNEWTELLLYWWFDHLAKAMGIVSG